MPDAEWKEYEAFLVQARRWHERFRELDNEVYRRNNPED